MNTILFGNYPQSEAPEDLYIKLSSFAKRIDSQKANGEADARFWTGDDKIKKQYGIVNNSKTFFYEKHRYRRIRMKNNEDRWFVYEPISWDVINEDDDTMTLMSKKVLDISVFNPNIYMNSMMDDSANWYVLQTTRPANVFYGSYLDLWLNYFFIHDAFTKEERDRMKEYELPKDYYEYSCGVYDDHDLYERIMYERKIQLPQIDVLRQSHILSKEPTAFVEAQRSIDEYWLMDFYDYYDSLPFEVGLLIDTCKGLRHANEEYGVVPLMTIRKKHDCVENI